MTISQDQLKAFEYYKKNCMSIEVVKDDYLQKVNFRVKNKVNYMSSDMRFQQCGMCNQQASDQSAHMRSLIRAFASRLNSL